MKTKAYNNSYFKSISDGSSQSAYEVIPVILQYISPRSVLDVGCGIGAWLYVWKLNRIKEVIGIDGHYVNKNQLLINAEEFIAYDLENGFNLNRAFDLVTCLEVAEHIKPENAELFIKSLCLSGDIILFSAAIPNQEGTLHLNEQYPQYWISLFTKNHFSPYDCLREKFWNNPNISWWYRQNLLFFINDEAKNKYPEIKNVGEKVVLPLVHPELLEYKQGKLSMYEKSLKNPFTAIIYFSKKYLRLIIDLFKK